jgi:hypothetical protein
MSYVRKVAALVKRGIVFAESPKTHQAWRFIRLAGAFIAASGIVDQLANGTATRAGIVAVAVGALEVAYRAKVKA